MKRHPLLAALSTAQRDERHGRAAPFARKGRETPASSEICGECGCRLPWHALDCPDWCALTSQRVSGA